MPTWRSGCRGPFAGWSGGGTAPLQPPARCHGPCRAAGRRHKRLSWRAHAAHLGQPRARRFDRRTAGAAGTAHLAAHANWRRCSGRLSAACRHPPGTSSQANMSRAPCVAAEERLGGQEGDGRACRSVPGGSWMQRLQPGRRVWLCSAAQQQPARQCMPSHLYSHAEQRQHVRVSEGLQGRSLALQGCHVQAWGTLNHLQAVTASRPRQRARLSQTCSAGSTARTACRKAPRAACNRAWQCLVLRHCLAPWPASQPSP